MPPSPSHARAERPHTAAAEALLAPLLLGAALLLAAGAVLAQTPVPSTPSSAEPPVIVPEVDRRVVRLPRLPSTDVEVGLAGGVYGTQNFGSSALLGLRLGYHVNEDVFVEGEWLRTRVSDQSFRAILPGGVLSGGQQSLTAGTLSLGVNVLPGEVFLGSRRARASQVFLLGGIGSTDFAGQKRQTVALGVGLKVFTGQRVSLRVDLRDHLYTLDLLGQRERTHNLQLTTGLSFYP